MKLANVGGRAAVLVAEGAIDVERASDGRFGPHVPPLYDDWGEFRELAVGLDPSLAEPYEESSIGAPVPSPRQVFAIGLNYRAHAEESGMAIPEVPATFTKFPASLTGPFDDVEVVGDSTDWEVELVAVIGRTADHVAAGDAWSYIAGLTVGQDLSDRQLQFAAGMQFSLGK